MIGQHNRTSLDNIILQELSFTRWSDAFHGFLSCNKDYNIVEVFLWWIQHTLSLRYANSKNSVPLNFSILGGSQDTNKLLSNSVVTVFSGKKKKGQSKGVHIQISWTCSMHNSFLSFILLCKLCFVFLKFLYMSPQLRKTTEFQLNIPNRSWFLGYTR